MYMQHYNNLYKISKILYGKLHPYTILYRIRKSPILLPYIICCLPFLVLKFVIQKIKTLIYKACINIRFNKFKKNNCHKQVSDFIKPLALYLPQYHEIAENNEWWGHGFTEWTNVKKAKPLFKNHYQPHIPHSDIGYYDLSDVNVMRKQAKIAKEYGIYGFCFYYYHFANSKRLLELPINNWLRATDINFPFCFAWANENWTRAWDGGDKEVIMPQDYDENNILQMINNMLPAFKDDRYIKIDNRPVLFVYRAEIIPQIKRLTNQWRKVVKENGFDDLYLVSMQNFKQENPYNMGFDAASEFAPQANAKLIDFPKLCLKDLCDKNINFITMSNVINTLTYRSAVNYPRIKCICPSWDNSPRKGEKASRVILETSPNLFKDFMYRAVIETLSLSTKNCDNILLINAWNEWGEGAHVEPDEKYGYEWLNVIKTIQNLSINKL